MGVGFFMEEEPRSGELEMHRSNMLKRRDRCIRAAPYDEVWRQMPKADADSTARVGTARLDTRDRFS